MIDWILAEWTQVLGFATGALCVYLAGRGNVWNYPIGIANTAILFVVFLTAGLYATAGLQVVFLAFGAHGWFRWTRRVERDRDYVGHTPRRATPILIVAGLLAFALLWVMLTLFTDSHIAIADAATTAAQLVAQYMLNRKWLESWPVWIAVDIAFVGVSVVTGLWVIAALYLLFIALAALGWRTWIRVLHADRESAGAPVATPEAEAIA